MNVRLYFCRRFLLEEIQEVLLRTSCFSQNSVSWLRFSPMSTLIMSSAHFVRPVLAPNVTPNQTLLLHVGGERESSVQVLVLVQDSESGLAQGVFSFSITRLSLLHAKRKHPPSDTSSQQESENFHTHCSVFGSHILPPSPL